MTVTVGILGAARIAPLALVHPARELDGIEVAAVAARAPARAAAFAAEHAIPHVLRDYDQLVDDPRITAIYVPTPAALHGYWIRRAVDAGKHVLCEKPFTANAAEALAIAEHTAGTPLVVMEAFHSLYHPSWATLSRLLASGVIGEVRRASARFVVPHKDPTDIRWQLALGGGALMDLGVYPVRLLRYLFGTPEIRSAVAEHTLGVDSAMTVEFVFPGGITAEAVASMRAHDQVGAELHVTGTSGTVHLRSPYHPHFAGQITILTAAGSRIETCDPRSTYSYQLQAFRDAIGGGAPVVTGAADAAESMRLIDDTYLAAGMRPRVPLC
ncbi:Gfo/Idh/MocA family protein [Nocardia halotolerans]|uniref:Gfo/Idh/MocA family protein n=1 Tax=Nocardia halotolerans TaxID=1755878 RepID=A0ABV8VN55_9NOCA